MITECIEMNIDEFRELMAKRAHVECGSKLFEMFHRLSQDAIKITMKLNNEYHTPEQIVEIFS